MEPIKKLGIHASNNSSTKLWILIIIFMLIPIVSCIIPSMHVSTITPLATSSASTNEWKTYTDSEIGFSIQYPSSWYYYRSSISDNNTQGGYILFSSALGNTSIQTRSDDEAARLVVSFSPNTSNVDVNGWLEGSPLLLYDVTKPNINGIKGIRIITPPENEVDKSSHIFLFLVTQSFQYSLVGTISFSPTSSEWSDMVVSIQNSFNPK